jgi:mycothiol synthase
VTEADGDDGTVIEVTGALAGPVAAGVLRLAGRAAARDGTAPLSEHTRLHLRYGAPEPARNLVLRRHGELAGYAHLDLGTGEPSAELVVAPGARRHGLGLRLARAVAAEAAPHPLRVWAHGDLPGAAALAARAGFTRVRALWTMRRPLQDLAGTPRYPPGVTVRPFEVGRDEAAWTELNRSAFASHPEQGAWTTADLALREQEPWFDPAGFFLAERHGRLAGFHWTKIHSGQDGSGPGRDEDGSSPGSGAEPAAPIGEVYVIGVDAAERGTGLGRALTLEGLHYLRSRGLAEVMLYVDEDNAPAIRLYESLGFGHWSTDVMFGHPGLAGPAPAR